MQKFKGCNNSYMNLVNIPRIEIVNKPNVSRTFIREILLNEICPSQNIKNLSKKYREDLGEELTSMILETRYGDYSYDARMCNYMREQYEDTIDVIYKEISFMDRIRLFSNKIFR